MVAFVATNNTKVIGEDITRKKSLTAVKFQADTRDLTSLVHPGAALNGHRVDRRRTTRRHWRVSRSGRRKKGECPTDGVTGPLAPGVS